MYSQIVNPQTGRKVKITGKLGRKIIKNYIVNLQNGGQVIDLKCADKIDAKQQLASGSFKQIFKTKCDAELWTNDGNLILNKENCDKSIFAISNTRDIVEDYYKELEIQKKLGDPEIYLHGKCSDIPHYQYKIEEKYDLDLKTYSRGGIYSNSVEKIDDGSIYSHSVEKIENYKLKFLDLLNNIKENYHSKNIGHFDIKPDNILVKLNNEMIQKLTLIDLLTVEQVPKNSFAGTPNYIDPAQYKAFDENGKPNFTYEIGLEVDIFALGITLLNTFFVKNFSIIIQPGDSDQVETTPSGQPNWYYWLKQISSNIDQRFGDNWKTTAKFCCMMLHSVYPTKFGPFKPKIKNREISKDNIKIKYGSFFKLFFNMIRQDKGRYTIDQVINDPFFLSQYRARRRIEYPVKH